MTDAQQVEICSDGEKRPRSGYGRLRIRHRTLIADHEAMKADYQALQIEQEALQKNVDRLLAEHKRLMQSVRTPSANWFEGANQTLAQLAANPEPRAVQIFVAALAHCKVALAQS